MIQYVPHQGYEEALTTPSSVGYSMCTSDIGWQVVSLHTGCGHSNAASVLNLG